MGGIGSGRGRGWRKPSETQRRETLSSSSKRSSIASKSRKTHQHGKADPNIKTPNFLPPNFDSLNPCKTPGDLKAPHLEHLYKLLLRISSDLSFHHPSWGGELSDESENWAEVKPTSKKTIVTLSELLFKVAHRKFEELFSHITSEHQQSNRSRSWQNLTLLLRCCMVILPLLDFDPFLISKRCCTLLAILEKSCFSNFELHDSCHNISNNGSGTCFKMVIPNGCKSDGPLTSNPKESHTFIHAANQYGSEVYYLCSIIEVFMDELLKNNLLKMYFKKYILSTRENVFHSIPDYMVLEVVSTHLLLSISDDRRFNIFLHTLFWSCSMEYKVPVLSLTATMSLLSHSVIFTAPKILQAHVVLLVSKCIGIHVSPIEIRSVPRLLNIYMSAFEMSVNLYNWHISSLQHDYCLSGINNVSVLGFIQPHVVGNKSQLSFEYCIQPTTHNKINYQIHKLARSYQSCSHGVLFENESDLLSTSLGYIEENKHILDESCRDGICSILNCMIERTLSSGNSAASNNAEVCQQEMYLLAAVLKLMSCTLLQIVGFMRQRGSLTDFKTLSDYASCGEYDFVIGIIGCFGKYSTDQPIQKILLDVMGMYPKRHKETKLMLVHLLALLLFAFNGGLEFLWKGCIFMMMALMNLLVFEEGSLDAFSMFLEFAKQPSSCQSSSAKVPQGICCKQSSRKAASNFRKIQRVHMRQGPGISTDERGADTFANNLLSQNDSKNSSIACDGDDIIKCESLPSDYDDLADYIDWSPGNITSCWFKRRIMFRKWKQARLAVSKRTRRKRLYSFIRSSR